MLKQFFQQPHRSVARRFLFQVHLWAGLLVGVHLAIVSLTGVVLLFKDEIQGLSYPHLYSIGNDAADDTGSAPVDFDRIIESMSISFPDHRVIRVEAPKAQRETAVIFAEKDWDFRRMYTHPLSGEILGEVPESFFLHYVDEFHASLFAGKIGRLANSTLALLALLLVVSGLVIWWPGPRKWWRSLLPLTSNGQPSARSLHRSIGIWTFAFIAMFAATGALFFFDRFLIPAVEMFSERSTPPAHYSTINPETEGSRARIQPMIDRLEEESAGRLLWGVVFPEGERDPVNIVYGPVGRDIGRDRWDWDVSGQRNFLFDQYSGEFLHQWDTSHRSLADIVLVWPAKLHTGEFGSFWAKLLWAVTGMAPVILFVLGFTMWWRRVIKPRRESQGNGR